MIRELISERHFVEKSGFRWRGGDVSRIEGLSDAVFAFAITLLVVALEVPSTFEELQKILYGFIGFAFSFALFIYIWHCHYKFFRRYGMQSTSLTVMNSVLLFFVLFYIYPLKFLSSYLLNVFSGSKGIVTLADGSQVQMFQGSDASGLMLIYSIGFAAIFLVFVLMHFHAYRKRKELNLSEVERLHTIASISEYSIMVLTGLLSILIVLITNQSSWAGWVYAFFIGPAQGISGFIMGSKIHKVRMDTKTDQVNT